MARLEPREADSAALALLGQGRCYWPDCDVKIYSPVDGRWVTNCERAHIEAAEENGPRWNSALDDEARRDPDNLLWLCVKHHKTIDRNPKKYTVKVLKEWKVRRLRDVPAQRLAEKFSEEELEQMIDQAIERMVIGLREINFPSSESIQMLVTASENMPTEAMTELLVEAGYRMPSEEIATTLYLSSERMPEEGLSSMLMDAAEKMPSEETAHMLLEAAEKLASEEWQFVLSESVQKLEKALDRAERVKFVETSPRIITPPKNMNLRSSETSHSELENPWAWLLEARSQWQSLPSLCRSSLLTWSTANPMVVRSA